MPTLSKRLVGVAAGVGSAFYTLVLAEQAEAESTALLPTSTPESVRLSPMSSELGVVQEEAPAPPEEPERSPRSMRPL